LKQWKFVRQNRNNDNPAGNIDVAACVCTCIIATHILSGFTLKENIKHLIENTVISQKGTLRIGKDQHMMGECIRWLLVGSEFLAYV
jgi:hypothetical protein